MTLPEGLDPCDFLHQKGAEAFSRTFGQFGGRCLGTRICDVTRGVDVDRDVHGASRALERLVSIVAKAPRLRADTTGEDRFREEKILQRLAAWFRVDEKEVRRRLTALRRRSQGRAANMPPATETAPAEQPGEEPETIDPAQREFLELLLTYPECLPCGARANLARISGQGDLLENIRCLLPSGRCGPGSDVRPADAGI